MAFIVCSMAFIVSFSPCVLAFEFPAVSISCFSVHDDHNADLAPQVSKSGQGNEKLRYSNGDEFEGTMQYLHTLFNPVGQGKYRVASTGALYSGCRLFIALLCDAVVRAGCSPWSLSMSCRLCLVRACLCMSRLRMPPSRWLTRALFGARTFPQWAVGRQRHCDNAKW